MKIKIFNGFWERKDVSNSNDIFVFGDNDKRIGKGGQAIIRDLKNTFGIRTKKEPNNNASSFYNDKKYSSNIKKIDEDILNLRKLALEGNVIVFSNGGYGTGLSKLPITAPKTFKYLCDSLKSCFEFDNEKGIRYSEIPGYDEIMNGDYLDLLNSNKGILQPINNNLFLNNLLKKEIYTTKNLIETENKTAFTSINKYDRNKILKIKTKNNDKYLVVKVIGSYQINKDNWSFFEGYKNKILDNIDIKTYYQIHFKYICTLSQEGKIDFKNDLFSKLNK